MNHMIDNLHLLVVHMGKKRCGTDWNYRDVCSPFTRIYYITAGEAEIMVNDHILNLSAGNMYIIPAFTRHSCRCRKEFEHYYIHLYNESGPYILEDWEFPREIAPTVSDIALIERLATLCPDMSLLQTDPKAYDNSLSLAKRIDRNKGRELWVKIESRGIIYVLLSRFLVHATPKRYCKDERIRTIVRHMRANLSSKIEIEQLAEMVHLSKDHLIRLFRREMHATPLNYLNARKIEAAQLRLVTESKPIKEIAYALGFEDDAYFNRLFKKMTGVTPLHYRQQETSNS